MFKGIIIYKGNFFRKYVFKEWIEAKHFLRYWKLEPQYYAYKNTVYMPTEKFIE